MTWTLMKLWVSGEHAEMDPEDIERGKIEFSCDHHDWMSLPTLRKLPCHIDENAYVA
jgi:hypothetical protein